MAFTNLTRKAWGSDAPTIYIQPAYEKRRSGANMQYRIKVTVEALKNDLQYFGYPIYAKIYLQDSLKVTKTLKSTSPSRWTSDIVYTSDWFTISNKTSGTTALRLNIYSGSGSSRNYNYSYSLPIDPASSVLGTISNFTMTSAINIPITKYSSSFTDSLTISLAGTTIKTISSITNGYDVSFTEAELSKIYGLLPNATSGSFTFKLTSKSGSTTIGTTSKQATGTIPSSVKPSISSVAISEGNTSVIPSDWGVYVKNKSKLKFDISGVAGAGSSISSVKTTINGSTYTGTNITTNLINTSGNLTATITITDKRNRTVSTTKTITIMDYEEPYFTTLNAFRCDVNGNASEKGTYLYVALKGGVSPLGGKNTVSYVIEYKKTTEEAYQTYTLDITEPTIDNYVILENIESSSSYNVRAVITDYFASVSKNAPPIPSVFRTVHYKTGGRGIAFGKMAEYDDVFEVAFKTKLTGGLEPVFLEAETDLNDVRTPNFYTGENISTFNYVNCPLTSGTFYLEVMPCGESGQVKQRIVSCHKTEAVTYERFYYQSEWGEWIRLSDFSNNLLWSGTYYMTDTQTITLAEAISKQATGIILVFSYYNKTEGAAENQNFNSFFVPKMLVNLQSGKGHAFQMNNASVTLYGGKYLYISDTQISGSSSNKSAGTSSGITFDNTYYVLRYVIGV